MCVGTYSTGGASYCTSCPAGTFSPANGAKQCTACPDGQNSAKGATSCSTCPPGEFTTDGVTCQWCGKRGDSSLEKDPKYHWKGGPTLEDCECEDGYVGTLCEYESCPAVIPGASLIGMLLHTDSELIKFSKEYDGSADSLQLVRDYLDDMFSRELDTNGDTYIGRDEVADALTYRSLHMDTQILESYPLWCVQNETYNCVEDEVPVSTLFDEAIMNHQNSRVHAFDGSGVGIFSSVSATFPDPTWAKSTCAEHALGVDVTASYSLSAVSYEIGRVCAYSNGHVEDEYSPNGYGAESTSYLSGSTTSLDVTYTGSQVTSKVVTCFLVHYRHCEQGEFDSDGNCTGVRVHEDTQYECALSLYYVSRCGDVVI